MKHTGPALPDSPNDPRKTRPSGGQRMTHGLVALSSAVVLGVYSAGYFRTQAAAERFTADTDARRAAPLAPASLSLPETPAPHGNAVAPERLAVAAGTPAEARVATPDHSAAAPVPRPALGEGTRSGDTADVASAAPRTTTRVTETPAALATTAAPVAPVAAVTPAPEPAAPAAPAAPRYKDGTFAGWGTSRHGDILASVVIEGGRITSARIAQCETRWPCTWIEMLPGQVVARQSAETDYVSGATQSTNAFYYAVVEALGKAKVQ